MDGVFDRRGLEVLGMDEALSLLTSVPVARIAFSDDEETFVAADILSSSGQTTRPLTAAGRTRTQ